MAQHGTAWHSVAGSNEASPTQGSIPPELRHNQASTAKPTASYHDNLEALPGWDKGWQVPLVCVRV